MVATHIITAMAPAAFAGQAIEAWDTLPDRDSWDRCRHIAKCEIVGVAHGGGKAGQALRFQQSAVSDARLCPLRRPRPADEHADGVIQVHGWYTRRERGGQPPKLTRSGGCPACSGSSLYAG